jgi:predicted  nucleic acid-binding Zn-ribbon protein
MTMKKSEQAERLKALMSEWTSINGKIKKIQDNAEQAQNRLPGLQSAFDEAEKAYHQALAEGEDKKIEKARADLSKAEANLKACQDAVNFIPAELADLTKRREEIEREAGEIYQARIIAKVQSLIPKYEEALENLKGVHREISRLILMKNQLEGLSSPGVSWPEGIQDIFSQEFVYKSFHGWLTRGVFVDMAALPDSQFNGPDQKWPDSIPTVGGLGFENWLRELEKIL